MGKGLKVRRRKRNFESTLESNLYKAQVSGRVDISGPFCRGRALWEI